MTEVGAVAGRQKTGRGKRDAAEGQEGTGVPTGLTPLFWSLCSRRWPHLATPRLHSPLETQPPHCPERAVDIVGDWGLCFGARQGSRKKTSPRLRPASAARPPPPAEAAAAFAAATSSNRATRATNAGAGIFFYCSQYPISLVTSIILGTGSGNAGAVEHSHITGIDNLLLKGLTVFCSA